jgi:signal peptidase I
MPGQTVWSAGDAIYVNGRKVGGPLSSSPALGREFSRPIPLTTVPAAEYFVMGDNSSQSCDSRSFGAVPASSIIGKVVSIVLREGHPYIHVF